MATVADEKRYQLRMRIAMVGGLCTEAGLRIAYLAGLIDVDEFEEGLELVFRRSPVLGVANQYRTRRMNGWARP